MLNELTFLRSRLNIRVRIVLILLGRVSRGGMVKWEACRGGSDPNPTAIIDS